MFRFLLACALAAPALLAQAPVLVSLTPATGHGMQASLTVSVTDPNGTEDIQAIRVLVQDSLDGEKACYVTHSPGTNTEFLRNDSDDQWGPPVPLTAAGTDSNSQCTLVGVESSATTVGDIYKLKLHLHFKKTFTGVRKLWVRVVDKAGLGASRWSMAGNWVVPDEPPASSGTSLDLTGLAEKGAVWVPNRIAVVGTDGKLRTVDGDATGCLRADGQTVRCAPVVRIERFKPHEGESSVQINGSAVAGNEIKVYRNGILLAPAEDYDISLATVQFNRPVRAGDIIQVEYWVADAP